MKRARLIGLSSIAVAALVGSILLAPPAMAAGDYHVSPSGDDTNSGTSSGSPFRTIQKALDVAASGSTVHLASGVYRQDAVTRVSDVTVTGPSDAVVKGGGGARIFQVHHDDVTLTGFTIDGLHGSSSSIDGYRDKLIYAISTVAGDGVSRLRILGMTLKNAGGECVRMRYLLTDSEVANNTIGPCGVHDFKFGAGGKNGEGIYIGTAPEQWGLHGAPDDRPDVSRDNWVHHNTIDTQGNECVDVKEASTANLVEHNDCTGQLDPKSAGLDSRGNGNTFRDNSTYDNVGAGIRFGGDTSTDGVDNDAYNNIITGNDAGGIKFMATPQRTICGNTMSDNTGGDSVGTYRDEFDPTAPCEDSGADALPVAGVTASGHDGNVPENTLDNDLSTRWSDQGDGVWIRYDLGSTVTVGWLQIAWHQGDQRVATFDVQTSTDGSSWTTVISGRQTSGSTLQQENYDFSDRTARYVRIVGHGNTVNDWTSITEVDIHGAGSPPDDPPPPGGCDYPAQILDLTNWKITLPIDDPDRSGTQPLEVRQPDLATYAISPWFKVTSTCDGVQFRSAVNAVTTPNSSYGRSELREMTNNGSSNASWSSTSGTHTLVVKEAFKNLPNDKPHVVGAQIHDGSDDVTVFRLEGSNLYITNGNTSHHKLVTSDYVLGTKFEAKFVVSGGQIKAYYNGVLQTTITKSFTGGYFKAGGYTQANCSNSSPCDSSNFGQVMIYDISVSHT